MSTWRGVRRVYLLITLLATLSASLIWGINTLFLLDAGLSNTEAFAANAFFTLGLMSFEIPTGVVADTRGRRVSYLLGAGTLILSTLLYLLMWQIEGPFWGWAVSSVLIGVGFTFFSGAVEAWLVDALGATDYPGNLESVFAAGQVVTGVAMLTGSIAGGLIAQVTNLGVPYIVRAVMLGLALAAAAIFMRDLGFTPERGKRPLQEAKQVLRRSVDQGLGNRPVRWVMIGEVFTGGVAIYAFYAAQPYLLDLYGDESAFGVAGLAAALLAGSQIIGGMAVPLIRRMVRRRTHALIGAVVVGVVALTMLGRTSSFAVALGLLAVWGLTAAASMPMRQAYLNGLIPSQHRATVLSFDSLMSSAGGVAAQPVLGRVADASGYPASYVVSAAISALCVPFLVLARRERASSDPIVPHAPPPGTDPPAVPAGPEPAEPVRRVSSELDEEPD